MAEVTVKEYETVEREETAWKCDNCGSIIHDESDVYEERVWRKTQSQGSFASPKVEKELCGGCVDADQHASLLDGNERRLGWAEQFFRKAQVTIDVVAVGLGAAAATALALMVTSGAGPLEAIIWWLIMTVVAAIPALLVAFIATEVLVAATKKLGTTVVNDDTDPYVVIGEEEPEPEYA